MLASIHPSQRPVSHTLPHTRHPLQELTPNSSRTTTHQPSAIDRRASTIPHSPAGRKPIDTVDLPMQSLLTPPPSSPFLDTRFSNDSPIAYRDVKSDMRTKPISVPTPPHSSPHQVSPELSNVPPLPEVLHVLPGKPVVVGRMVKAMRTSKVTPYLLNAFEPQFYTLPLDELEISRLHAVLERVSDGVRLKVIGKNGVKVAGLTVKDGQEMTILEGQGSVELHFWVKTVWLRCGSWQDGAEGSQTSFNVKVEDAESKDFSPRQLTFHPAIPLTPSEERLPTTSLPPSSPPSSPLSALSSDRSEESYRASKPRTSAPDDSPDKTLIKDADTSMQRDDPAHEDTMDEDMEDDAEEDDEADDGGDEDEEDPAAEAPLPDEESPPSSPTPSAYSEGSGIGTANENGKRSSSPLPSPVLAKRPRLPDIPFDDSQSAVRIAVLPHLVTALALSITATTPLSALLPELLDQPQLAAYDHEEVASVCRRILEGGEGGMFGKVVRHGKDASGHPLENLYFYKPENDLDKERAANVGGFGRRVRGAQMSDKQYYWRPVGRRRS